MDARLRIIGHKTLRTICDGVGRVKLINRGSFFSSLGSSESWPKHDVVIAIGRTAVVINWATAE